MKGNFHVRFLGGKAPVRELTYPALGQHEPAHRGGQRQVRLQRLPVRRHDLRPAFHHPGEECHGAEPRDAGAAAQLHPQRQQPPRVHPGGVPRGGKQGYQNV